jgi:hypothetical protein
MEDEGTHPRRDLGQLGGGAGVGSRPQASLAQSDAVRRRPSLLLATYALPKRFRCDNRAPLTI